MKISPTRLKQFKECRSTYVEKYIQGIRSPTNTWTIMGTALHKTLEYYYNELFLDNVTLERYFRDTYRAELDHQYDTAEVIEYVSPNEAMAVGQSIVASYPYDLYLQVMYNELEIEMPFEDEHYFHGIIDLITADGVIVDFKSAKAKPKQTELDSDPQFLLYADMYRARFGKLPRKVIRHHLRDHTTMELNLDGIDNRLENVYNTARELIKFEYTGQPIERCVKCPPWCSRFRERTE